MSFLFFLIFSFDIFPDVLNYNDSLIKILYQEINPKVNFIKIVSRSYDTTRYVLLAKYNIALKEDHLYKLTFKAKGKNVLKIIVAFKDIISWRPVGLYKSFGLTNKWHSYEFIFWATKTLKNARFQIWFFPSKKKTEVYIKDLQFEELPVDIHPKIFYVETTENYLDNSSFEVGSWGFYYYNFGKEPELDSTFSKEGKFSALLKNFGNDKVMCDYPRAFYKEWKEVALIPSKWFYVKKGKRYNLNFWVKANKKSKLKVKLWYGGSKIFDIDTFWRNIKYSFIPQKNFTYFEISPFGAESLKVWIDCLYFGLDSVWKPKEKVEAGLYVLPNPFEPESLNFIFYNYSDKKIFKKFCFKILNFYEDTIFKVNLKTCLLPNSRQNLKISLKEIYPHWKRGFYKLILISGKEVVIRRIIYGYKGVRIRKDIFGTNHPIFWKQHREVLLKFGIKWVRDWSLKWKDFEVNKESPTIKELKKEGFKILALIPFPYRNPRWKYPPEYEWHNYIKNILKCNGKFTNYWQILNEPLTYYALPSAEGYTVNDYIKLLNKTYYVFKRDNPKFRILAGFASPIWSRKDLYLKFVNMAKFDILTFHIYMGTKEIGKFNAKYVGKFKKILDGKDIWVTECGYVAYPFEVKLPVEKFYAPVMKEEEASLKLLKLTKFLLKYGKVKKIFYHISWDYSTYWRNADYVFLTYNCEPKKFLALLLDEYGEY